MVLAQSGQLETADAAEDSLTASHALSDDGAEKGLWLAAAAKALNFSGKKKAEATEQQTEPCVSWNDGKAPTGRK